MNTLANPINFVRDVPRGFKDWVENNQERIARAKSLPYFLKDNERYWKKPTPHEIAMLRHANRTPADVDRIRMAWNDRHFSREQLAQFPNLSKALGKERGLRMTVEEADKQNANPNYSKDKMYQINCQTCVQAFALRLRGYNVTAKGNVKGSMQEFLSKQNSNKCWKNADGSEVKTILYSDWLKAENYKQMNSKRYYEFFNEYTKDEGFYIVTIGWKNGNGGHATILQRKSSGELVRIEPQYFNGNVERNILELCEKGEHSVKGRRGIFRVDNKIFDEEYCLIFD